jgi:hypothetical protein
VKADGCDDEASTDEEQRLALPKDLPVAFAKAFIQQYLGGSSFDSSLITYAAMLSVSCFGH